MQGKGYRRDAGKPLGFRRQLVVNSMASGLSNVWAMVAGLVALPLLLAGLGREAFGAWALVMTFSATNGWLSLADLGVGVATTRRVASSASTDDESGVRRTVGAAFGLVAGSSAVAAVLLVAVSEVLPSVFNIPAGLVTPFRTALQLMALQVVIDQMVNVAEAVLEGLQRVDVSRAIDSFRRLIVLGAATVTAIVTHDLVRVATASLLASVAALAVAGLALRAHLPRTIALPTRADVADLMRTGREIAVLRPLGVIQRTMDRMLVGIVIGPGAVALVEVATQLQAAAEAVLSATSYSIVPAASWLGARDDRAKVTELAERGTLFSMVITVPVAIAVGTLAGPFVHLWLGDGYERVGVLAAVAAACVVVNAPLAVGSQLLVGAGRTRVVLRAAGVALVVNLVASVVLLDALGVVGVFIGTFVANIVLIAVLGPAVCDEAGVDPGAFVRASVIPVLRPAAVQLIVAVALLAVGVHFVIVGAASLAPFAAVALRTAVTPAEMRAIWRPSGDVEHPLERGASPL